MQDGLVFAREWDKKRLTIGSVQDDVSRPRSQTRQRLVTLAVQPVQEAGPDVFVVVLSLCGVSPTLWRLERCHSEGEEVRGGATDALTRGFRACRRTQEATLMADLTGLILTVECGTMFHLSARGEGICKNMHLINT